MEYNNLGKAGLKVSELSLGSWLTFGSSVDVKTAGEMMRLAFDQGVNFFDNAEEYAHGRSEEIMGEALRSFNRSDLVVSTKIYWGGNGPNDTGLNWKHLVEGTKRSLKRLKLEYVDLLFCHRPDFTTPVEETVRAMDCLVRSGLVFYWGTSEWPLDLIEEAFHVAKENHCVPPTMEQPQYNMLWRDRIESEYVPLYRKYKLGLTTWSPLASGILTGKYNEGIPAGSRLEKNEWLRDQLTPSTVEKVRGLARIAKEVGCTLGQLAIVWCLKNQQVSSVILGASSPKQLTENIEALRYKPLVHEGLMGRIEEVLLNKPKRSTEISRG
ncbi:MAG: aldo/keto reductase [Bdellovibrionota bacterium]|nr:MAG: aldo/keto reductase [Bdellovibrionota bacterium]